MSTGIFSLSKYNGSSDLSITSAGTTTCDVISDLAGMTAVSIQARFAYGSGGTTAKVYVQTSLSQSNDWVDVACIAFATTSETQVLNLSGLTPKGLTVPTDGALTDDTVLDGILGDRLRVKVVSVGTYANTTLSVRASVR